MQEADVENFRRCAAAANQISGAEVATLVACARTSLRNLAFMTDEPGH